MSTPGPAIDARRVIADLRELARRTSDDRGAQRVAWTETWRQAGVFLDELLAEIDIASERDEAGNVWARLEGEREDGALALGSHLDSVPAGGWLDGALGVMAGLGVLRAWVGSGRRPPRPLTLVSWADEEGARFGRSLFGSSAFSGTLDPAAVQDLHDHQGRALPVVLAENGVELDRIADCGRRRDGLAAYLELHIEQGPVMEAEGITAAAVEGCAGVERHKFTVRGQASHAGTTPMAQRRDAGLAAAEATLRIEGIGASSGGVATTGVIELHPGIATAVAGEAELTVDLRHRDAEALERMLAAAREAVSTAAWERQCESDSRLIWRIEPIPFDERLVTAAREVCREVTGIERALTSGALHDAAELARVLPAAMVFVASIRGISHAREEDTREDDLATGLDVFGQLANRVLLSG